MHRILIEDGFKIVAILAFDWCKVVFSLCVMLLNRGLGRECGPVWTHALIFPLSGVSGKFKLCFNEYVLSVLYSGEKCNKASADAANLNRSFSGSRQQCGRKMDYLFKTKDADVELGCGECALVGGINTTKEFQDAGFKMPKVMRDMMFKIVADSPGLVHKLHIPGFYIADKVLTLWILDTPAGYVGRYDAFPSVQYPITESKIRIRMATLLTRNMAARIIMEQCQDIIDDDDSEPSIDRYQFVMEPSFVPVGLANKKRKQ